MVSRMSAQRNRKEEREEEILDLTAEQPKVEKKCAICGKRSARKAYGGTACGSCKSFFFRATTSPRPISACTNGGFCEPPNYLNSTNKKCIACRFQRCLDMGMIPEITARRYGCEIRKRRALAGVGAKEDPQIPSTSHQIALKEFQIAAQNFARPLVYERLDAADVVRSLVNIQNVIAQDSSARLVFDFPYSFDGKISQVLHNPMTICSRVPFGYDERTQPEIPTKDFPLIGARIVARNIVYCIDLFRAIPEFWHLGEHDRMKLISAQFAIQGMFNDYYHTHKYAFNGGILASFGLRMMSPDGIENFVDTFNWHIPYGANLVVPCIRRAEMRDEEFLLIKAILLFSSDVGFSDTSAQVIRKAFNKYTSILFEHLKTRFRSESLAIERFHETMNVPRYLMNASQKVNNEFARNVLTKYCGLDGPLLEELFHHA